MLKPAASRSGFFERDQFEAVSRELPPDVKVAVLIAYTHGWRIASRVLPLEWRQIGLEAETLRLDPGGSKNGDGRVVYMTPEIKAALSEQLACVRALEKRIGKIVPFVFPSPRDVVRGAQRKTIRQAWRGACQRVGCPHMLRHDLRRTAVRNMLNLGLSERLVMKIVGHRTRSMLDRYHIIAPADLRDAARRVAQTEPRTESGTARP